MADKDIVIEFPEDIARELLAELKDLDKKIVLTNQLFTFVEILENQLNLKYRQILTFFDS